MLPKSAGWTLVLCTFYFTVEVVILALISLWASRIVFFTICGIFILSYWGLYFVVCYNERTE